MSTRAYLFQGWLWARVLRALRRDQAWVLTVRPFSDDPLGKPVYRETVAGIAEVGPGMERVEQAIRAGRVPVPTLEFRSDHPTATPR